MLRSRSTILALDSDPNSYSDFYHALESDGEVVVYPTLEGLLSDDPRSKNTIVLLDVDDLRSSPTALVVQLLDRQHRQPMALTTGRGIEDYFNDLRRWGLLQVAVKCPVINREEVVLFLGCVRSPSDGFGLSRYLAHTVEMYNLSISTFEEKNSSIERVINHFATTGFEIHELFDVRLILEEALNNAFFHAFKDRSGKEKYSLENFRGLEAGDKIRVEYGNGALFAGFSVTDNAGGLSVKTILTKLERQYNKEGLYDERGRGLYLARQLSSRMIFNIEQKRRTQIVALFDDTRRGNRPKPFMINFTGDDSSTDGGLDSDLD